MQKRNESRNAWSWVPTLYYAEGIPYIVVMVVSVIMYKRFGISNAEIAFYTSSLSLPWVIKPLWSPFVDILKTRRYWIILTQLILGAGLGGIALSIPGDDYFRYTLAFLWLLSFSSATHDIAADGFYMLGLSKHKQAFFVGVRSTFYRLAMITGQGVLIILAGYIESTTGLATVDLQVKAQQGSAATRFLHPDSVTFSKTDDAEMRILAYPENLEIGLSAEAEADKMVDILARIESWNNGQGMQDGSAFTPVAGAGFIYFRLSHPPAEGETVVINFGRDKGDKSIKLVAGSRFEFTVENWQRPQIAAIQLDERLKMSAGASFSAKSGNIKLAWIICFAALAMLFLFFTVYHYFILPHPASDVSNPNNSASQIYSEFITTFVSFFKKKNIGVILAFLLLYRFAEAQLVRLAQPFMLDSAEVGGLALATGEVGFAYGTVGTLALTIGGILGGLLVAKDGLKKWLWPMVFAINMPNVVYVFLAYALPDNFIIINFCVAIEQFGYGFGFTAFMLYMIYAAEGEHKTAHFAICTGFMALGMMLPGMWSGQLQELIGYQYFFIWVMLATIPGFIAARLIHIEADFGKKKE